MEDTQQPNIHFFRTKRFWFRWAVPGLLVGLWVESMLFKQFSNFCFSTSSSEIDYSIATKDGVLSLRVFKETYPYGFPGPDSGWTHLSSGIQWQPGLNWFPTTLDRDGDVFGCLSLGRYHEVSVPLWVSFVLWLLIAYLWSKHQKRKQAALK